MAAANGPSWMANTPPPARGPPITNVPLMGPDSQTGYLTDVSPPDNKPSMIRMGFRCFSIFNGVLMIVAAFIEMANLSGSDAFTKFWIAVYNLLFAAILLVYEAQAFQQCQSVDNNLRRYFGVVYGSMGRACFLIFIAFLNFALEDAGGAGIAAGILLLVEGGLMLLLYFRFAHLLDDRKGGAPGPAAPGKASQPTQLPSTTL